MTERDLLRYIAAFNRRDYAAQHAFYDPDVTLELPGGRLLVGPSGIRAFYDDLHAGVREMLALDFCMAGADHLAVEIYTEFHAIADRTLSSGLLRAGEVHRCTNMVHYDLRDGLMHRIRVAGYRTWHDGERAEAKDFPGIDPPVSVVDATGQ